MKPVMSLTSIPPRLPHIGPALRALAAQGEVWLCLPRAWRRFPGAAPRIEVPDGVRLCIVDADEGPATKALPAARALAGSGRPLVYCDDDWIYGPGWLDALAETAAAHPGAAVAAAPYDGARIGWPGLTVAQGFAGVLVSPDWLADLTPPQGLEDVDDLWLSAALHARGIPMVAAPSARALARPSGNEAAPLQACDRAALMRRGVDRLRRTGAERLR